MGNWDSFPIIEELLFHDPSLADGVDPMLIDYEKKWPKGYFVEVREGEERVRRNYFIVKMTRHGRYALPLLKCIKHWM